MTNWLLLGGNLYKGTLIYFSLPFCSNFNKYSSKCCEVSNDRKLSNQIMTIKEKWQEEQKSLLRLPKNKFCIDEVRVLKVNNKSLISFEKNNYSVPVKLIGRQLEIHINSLEIKCYFLGLNVAQHIRIYGSNETSMKLDHYLDLLRYKPGAFKGSLVLMQAKEKCEWPAIYDEFWRELNNRFGESKGTQMLIDTLLLHREYGEKVINDAVNAALRYGSYDIGSLMVIIRQKTPTNQAPLLQDLGGLQRYDRSFQSLEEYSQLLS